jgi:glucose-1-phosphate thymidylyltransferase
MKSLILAAGYATRLYPLTQNFPKPLLEVQGRSILDRLIDDIDKEDSIDGHIIISNHKFVSHFEDWKKRRGTELAHPVTIIDDGSTENDNRLGAVKDIAFAVEQLHIDDDIFVLAGDNVLDFSLADFILYQKNKGSSCIMRHYEGDTAKLRRTGVLTIDSCDRVIEMQEKPAEPKSNWACPPFYMYAKKDIPLILQAVQTNVCGTDAPGDFIAWFCSQRPVYAWLMSGRRYDIGTLDSYEEAQKIQF